MYVRMDLYTIESRDSCKPHQLASPGLGQHRGRYSMYAGVELPSQNDPYPSMLV